MLCGYFPYFTYAVPAVAGLCVMAAFIEFGGKWAWLCFLASILPILLFSENEVKLLYVAFFGYYPILKAYYEKISNKILSYAVKLLHFNLFFAVTFYLTTVFIGVFGTDGTTMTPFFVAAFWLICNVAFVLYDICVAKLATVYINKLHPLFNKGKKGR
ncbi:MAG: hypothetical protein KBS41_05960 [Oscillospiraceae bacterium]|nr:hypothetical protein [Candidatus Equicaccousia limihippi]